jgi:molecular chaperone HscB
MSDFFSFFELEPAFILDQQLLRRKFLELSRKYHPDFYGAESDEKQAEALELSSKNTEAFKVLSDFDKRFAYILNIHGLLDEQKNKNALPQNFLFEMMELNEALSELENSCAQLAFEKLKAEINNFKKKLFEAIEPDLSIYKKDSSDELLHKRLLEFYLKKKYLNRLEERLTAFKIDIL